MLVVKHKHLDTDHAFMATSVVFSRCNDEANAGDPFLTDRFVRIRGRPHPMSLSVVVLFMDLIVTDCPASVLLRRLRLALLSARQDYDLSRLITDC